MLKKWHFPSATASPIPTFEYSDFSVEPAADGKSFEVSVDVTNTGDIDAKHTVQIYFSSPYTEYDRQNGVEKAAVELCGFDKKEVPAGDTVNYTITVNTEDLTSYDANVAKTYILEDGDYWFTRRQKCARRGKQHHPREGAGRRYLCRRRQDVRRRQ